MQTWQPRTLTGVAFLLAAVLFFVRLGDLPLIDPDEGRNAEVAREMAESGAWVVPTFNAIPYLDKPALYFRAVALSFGAFGRSETDRPPALRAERRGPGRHDVRLLPARLRRAARPR